MIRNYIKIAIQKPLEAQKFLVDQYNRAGCRYVCFLLILMYVSFELSYDRFHTKANQIYRLNVDIKSANDVMKTSYSSAPMGTAIKADFPEVIESTRIFPAGALIKVDQQLFKEDRIFIAEPSIFDVFSLPLVKGDPKTALKDPFSVILTETTAKKYFGSADPIGKSLLNGQ